MKLKPLGTIFFLLAAGCSTTKKYNPQTFFPNGTIHTSASLNPTLSTNLHQFIEFTFFNDNKEWVNLQSLNLKLNKGFIGQVLNKEQVKQWVSLRSEELISESSSGSRLGGGLFSLLSFGTAVVEVSTGSDNENSSSLAEVSDELDESALNEENDTMDAISRTLEPGELTVNLNLPPGRTIKRWIIINSPNQNLPSNILLSFKGFGVISKASKAMSQNLQLK